MATFSEPKRFYRHMQGLSSADQREFIMMVVRAHRHMLAAARRTATQ